MPRAHSTTPARLVWPPTPGTFTLRRVRGGWRVPAMIARDEDGLWYAIIDGTAGDCHADPAHAPGVDRIWTSGERICQSDYDYLVFLKNWAVNNDPDHPCVNPYKPIDPHHLRPLAPR